jgi:hypothetical protein
MHYVVIVDMLINGKSASEAFDLGLDNIKKFVPEFVIEKEAFLLELKMLRRQIG